MDVHMRDSSSRPRRTAASRSNASQRRTDPYQRDARHRPNAPARDDLLDAPRSAATAYPPPQLNIKGSSGPTWLTISNLALGTSADDIELTFGSFGTVTEVKQRTPPGQNHPSVSFEVGFEHRADAELAVEKFHGALADGRVLSVSINKPEQPRHPYAQFARATAAAVAQRPRERAANLIPAPAPAPAAVVPPTGPAAMRASKAAKVADLLDPRAKKGAPAAVGGAGGKHPPTGAKAGKAAAPPPPPAVKSLKDRLPEPLANRLLTPAQAQKLRAAEARQRAKADAQAKAQAVLAAKKGKGPAGAKGAAAAAAGGKPTSLQARITVPLAERLAKQAGRPKSDLTAQRESAENKKNKQRAAAVAAKKKKKSAATAAAKAQAGGGAVVGGMDVDA